MSHEPEMDIGQPRIPMREWASVHAELLWIYNHKVPDKYLDWEVQGQRQVYRAWLIHRGKVRVTLASGECAEAGPGLWMFPPRSDFHQEFSGDAQILSISFLCEWPSREGLVASREAVVVESARFPALERRARQLERVVGQDFREHDTRYYERFVECGHFLSVHTLFLKWLKVWLEVQNAAGAGFTRLLAGDDRVTHALRCLNSSPFAGGFPRDALMRETGLSEAHLNRLFVAEYGMTTRRTWESRRLNEARRCLETSGISIKEIAYRLGFRADAHFTTWFKKLTGKRPNVYRKTHREH